MKTSSAFLNGIIEYMQARQYAKRTIETYLYWIRQYILFNHKQHPSQLAEPEVEAFLTYLVTQRNVAVKTQAVALNSLSFLYKEIISKPLSLKMKFMRANVSAKLPEVLTQIQVRKLLSNMNTNYKLMADLMYGSGLRLMEAVRLRVKDIDYDYCSVLVWHGKGNKNRRVTLAPELIETLKAQTGHVERVLKQDLSNENYAGVWLPNAMAIKSSNATRELGWHYLFPANKLSIDPESNLLRRHHIDEKGLQRAVKKSAMLSNIDKNVSCHTLRHYVPFLIMSGNMKYSAGKP